MTGMIKSRTDLRATDCLPPPSGWGRTRGRSRGQAFPARDLVAQRPVLLCQITDLTHQTDNEPTKLAQREGVQAIGIRQRHAEDRIVPEPNRKTWPTHNMPGYPMGIPAAC